MQPIQSFMPLVGVVLLVIGFFVFGACRMYIRVASRSIVQFAESQEGTKPGAMGRALTALLQGVSIAAIGAGIIALGLAAIQ